MNERKIISLTLDDGPVVGITDQVLDILEQYNAKASFFIIGQGVNEENKYLIERAYKMGCTIENHSWTHSSMPTLTKEEIADEIKKTTDLIESIVGEKPEYFRPPYIDYDQKMYDVIDLGFICGYGCNDWDLSVTTDERIKMVLEAAKDKQIVLLHDMKDNQNTVEAIKVIIPELIKQGYELVNIRELFNRCGVKPERNCTYMCVDEIRNNYQ